MHLNTEGKRYNLKSGRKEICLRIEHQMCQYDDLPGQGCVSARSSPVKPKLVDQDKINRNILTQRNGISDRLIKIENASLNCKKTSDVSKHKDKRERNQKGLVNFVIWVSSPVNLSASTSSISIPPLESVRQDARAQQKVQDILRELC